MASRGRNSMPGSFGTIYRSTAMPALGFVRRNITLCMADILCFGFSIKGKIGLSIFFNDSIPVFALVITYHFEAIVQLLHAVSTFKFM